MAGVEDWENELTPKQRAFVREYLLDLNATQAAIRAGYSERSAHVEGVRLLKNAKVDAAVSAAMHLRAHRTEITSDRVLKELAELLQVAARLFGQLDDGQVGSFFNGGFRFFIAPLVEKDEVAAGRGDLRAG